MPTAPPGRFYPLDVEVLLMLCHSARLLNLFTRPFRAGAERGATAVEYGLMIAGIAVVIAAIVITVGEQAGAIFTDISTRFP